ncbi:MAG: DUF2179 domain-containing protein [Tepidisphaeraceae bacterium]
MDLSAHAFLIALGIFCLRICDVSVGTVRVMFTVRGQKLVSAILGAVESFIWIFAISRAIKYVDNPLSMAAWALGFATGTVVGIALEQWIASGSILVRAISRNHAIRLKELLHTEGFGVTAVQGQGRETTVLVLFVVAPRKRLKELLGHINRIDPEAFVTIEPVAHAIGGYLPQVTIDPVSMRK